MRQNFENGMRQVTGDYVIFFGDDDGILPGQFRFLRRLLEERQPDALSWSLPTYGWPIEGFGKRTGTVRYMKHWAYGTPDTLDIEARRRAILAARHHRTLPQPALYHGCISRRYLEAFRGPSGDIINGAIPDIHITYRIYFRGGTVLHVPHMFSINGFSPASTGNAQHAYNTTDKRAEPALRFKAENQADPLPDVIENVPCIPLIFLQTLETVRHHFPEAAVHVPDYEAWYRYVLNAPRRGDTKLATDLDRILTDHATRTGTLPALETARTRPAPPDWRWYEFTSRLKRMAENAGEFRASAAMDGENTILTAARTCDRLLGDDFGAVLDGRTSRARAWAALKARARG